ncbi:SCO4225 family membrane protein [Micromonospora deserti]|uniref:SCO4225 family membrane protein n=1 Tax=Micromonospora deserti TaxID=2070366 RepID=UPI000DA7882C
MRLLRKAAAGYSNGISALAISGSYATIVLGAFGFVVIANLLGPGSMAGIWLVMATLPSSLLIQFIPAEGDPYSLFLTLGGLAQAWLLWIGLRGKRLS